MTLQAITQIGILVTGMIWVIWDYIVYTKQGNLPTESWTVKKWSFRLPGIALLVGILIGHVFFTFTAPEQLCRPDPVPQIGSHP